jgi:hypothetical protein
MARDFLMGILALVGCNDNKGDDSRSPGDADGDGYSSPEDCDDTNDAIHPEAVESCDGADNDCDGVADGPDATDAVPYWPDEDSDGFGAGMREPSCTPLTGAVENGDDCDDTRADLNPNATEICDPLDVDEDCDSLADDDDDDTDETTMGTFYADADGDGFGDAETRACDIGGGNATTGGDCDDTDAEVHPDAIEICGDLVDNDCDGGAVGCGWSGTADAGSASATITGVEPNGYFGQTTEAAGDVNGDGIDDLMVGSMFAGAYLFLGPVADMTADSAAARLTSTDATDANGSAGSRLGDQDGDGYDDIVVSAYGWSLYTGRAYVILGPLSGTDTSESVAAATVSGTDWAQFFGFHPTSGDLNGDGTPDLAVGAPTIGASSEGATYVFYGPITEGDLTATVADATLVGVAPEGWTGRWNSADGDLDGDGIDDLVVGAPNADTAGADNGSAWLFFGPVTAEHTMDDADVWVHGAEDHMVLGYTGATAGDLDDDGLDDLVVSGPGVGDKVYEGRTWVVSATSVTATSELDVATTSTATLHGESLVDWFGYTVDSAGDFDTDGTDDLVITEPYRSAASGTAYVFAGPVSGTLSVADAYFQIEGDVGEFTGSAVSYAGDLDDNGTVDLALGSRDGLLGGEGAVTVWYNGGF